MHQYQIFRLQRCSSLRPSAAEVNGRNSGGTGILRATSAALGRMVGMAEHRSAVQYQSIMKPRESATRPPSLLNPWECINWGLDHIGVGCACS